MQNNFPDSVTFSVGNLSTGDVSTIMQAQIKRIKIRNICHVIIFYKYLDDVCDILYYRTSSQTETRLPGSNNCL